MNCDRSSAACFALFALSLVAAPLLAQQSPESSNSKALDYTTSWIGNTFSGGNYGPNDIMKHVQLDIDSIYVTGNGEVYTNTGWDEGGRSLTTFKDGNIINPLNVVNDNNGGGDNAGGLAVAADDRWVYQAEVGGGIQIKNLSDHSAASVSLTGSTTLASDTAIYGMALKQGKLYVTENDVNAVDIFDTKTLSLVKTLAIQNPSRIAVDCKGGLWISHQDQTPVPSNSRYGRFGTATIDHFDPDGSLINSINLPGGGQVGALWIDRFDRLYVGDDGPDQNVKIYSGLFGKPSLERTFGEKGGIYAGSEPGHVGPHRFHGITGVGTDNAGNIYVSQNEFGFSPGASGSGGASNGAGTVLRGFTPNGQLKWSVYGLVFVDVADADPGDERDIYDSYHHFRMDYDKPAGKEEHYVADTVDPVRYPQDIRLTNIGSYTQIQRIKGKKFMFVGGQYGGFFAVYRFDEATGGEIAIPCAGFDYGGSDYIVHPANGEYIWRDLNGDGQMTLDEFSQPANATNEYGVSWWADTNGDVWQVIGTYGQLGIRRYLFQGFDEFGAPVWDYKHVKTYPYPADFTSVQEAVFIPGGSEGGSLYVAGDSTGAPATAEYAGNFTKIARYDHWEKGNRTAKWVTSMPFAEDPNSVTTWAPNAFAVAGDFVFADFWIPHYVAAFSAENGKYTGRFVPGKNVGGVNNVGNTDIAQSINAFQRSNGEYMVLQEEDFQAKTLLYRWTPPSTLPTYGNPSPPANIKVSPDDQTANFSWSPGSGALATNVYRGATSGGPYTRVKAGINGTSVADTGISNTQPTYYVLASLADTGQTSAYSKEIKVTGVSTGTTYEAEKALLNGEGTYGCPISCSGGFYVGDLNPGATITFNNVVVPKAGTYAVRIYEGNWNQLPLSQEYSIDVVANGGLPVASPPLPFTGDPTIPAYVVAEVTLKEGTNMIELTPPASQSSQEYTIDRIVVPAAPQ